MITRLTTVGNESAIAAATDGHEPFRIWIDGPDTVIFTGDHIIDNFSGLDSYKLLKRAEIDKLAHRVRLTYVSGGLSAIEEYRLAYSQALEYFNNGMTVDIPQAVQSDMDYSGRNNIDATYYILGMANYYDAVLNNIRTVRLNAKKDISNSSTGAQIDAVTDQAKSDLDSLSNHE